MRFPLLEPRELARVEERARSTIAQSLMLRAGRATAEVARRMAQDSGAAILVVSGPGNNGGDGWCAAAALRETFHRVVVTRMLIVHGAVFHGVILPRLLGQTG